MRSVTTEATRYWLALVRSANTAFARPARNLHCSGLRLRGLRPRVEVIVEATEYGIPIIEIVKRLLAALFLGAMVGWERECKHKPAGLRTHMLVTLGAATFCIMAFEVGAQMAHRYGDRGVDPMRVLQGVVGGIGFLCAGGIVQSRGRVEGVTTAAGVWIAGALGAACGVGAYVLAVLSATFTVVVLALLGRLERPDPGQPKADAEPDTQQPSKKPPVAARQD